jgi:thioesterase domain-containing protein
MASHLEHQGEQVALLAVMDTDPGDSMVMGQTSIEDQDDGSNIDAEIRLFVNCVGDALPDSARPYIEKFKKVRCQLYRLYWNHTSPKCHSGMILFRAMVQTDPSKQPISPYAWKPHVMGKIEVFDIGCTHVEMDQPAPLAEIGRVLAQRLNAIHTVEVKELYDGTKDLQCAVRIK